MRLVALYLRSRLAGRTVAVLVTIAALTWLWLWWASASAITLTLLPLAMPLAAAAVIGAGTGSPFGESETTASRSLGPLRLGHATGLLLIGALTLVLAGLHWSVPDSVWTLIRNLAGFTGLALLTARVLGGGLSWVTPLGYAVLSLLAVQSGPASHWAWPVYAGADREAAVIAAALLLLGLGVSTHAGARDSPTETA
jgi:hypothetical protein